MEKRRKVYIPIMRVNCLNTYVTPIETLGGFISFLHNTNREAYTRLVVSILTRFHISPREAFSKVSQTSANNMSKEIVEFIHSHLESEAALYPLYVFDSLAACNEYLKLYDPLTKCIKYFELYISGQDSMFIGDIDDRSELYLTNKPVSDRLDHNTIVLEKIDDTGLWKYCRWDSSDTILDEYDVFVETDKEVK
jgi:hypothetical protein